jgi:hypothetical protein
MSQVISRSAAVATMSAPGRVSAGRWTLKRAAARGGRWLSRRSPGLRQLPQSTFPSLLQPLVQTFLSGHPPRSAAPLARNFTNGPPKPGFAPDSPLEGDGFEPSVPPISSVVTHGTPARHPRPHFTAGTGDRRFESTSSASESCMAVSGNTDFPVAEAQRPLGADALQPRPDIYHLRAATCWLPEVT